MLGTSDQSCWLAEACKTLLLVEALTGRLQGTGSGSPYYPRAGPAQGVVSCTYEQWLKPYSPRGLHVGGIVNFLFLGDAVHVQFRLACHGLPIATGRLAGAGHTDRANRICLACNM